MSNWLLRTDRQIQQYFLGLILLFLSLGCIRFLLPFQVINVGGNYFHVSNASALFAIGQIIGLTLLGSLIVFNKPRFLLGGGFLMILLGFMSISIDHNLLIAARLAEGCGYGIIFLGIISLASEFQKQEGEALGALFAAVFIGLALGQGLGGISWNGIRQIEGISSIQSIRIISGVMIVFTLISIVTIIKTSKQPSDKIQTEWKWQHFHIGPWVKKLLVAPSILLLLVIYALYDFAHGIYTPNLSILLTEQGISEIGVSLGYLTGDMMWGVSQIFAGRFIDRTGYYIPLIFSLALKGITVIFYPEVSFMFAFLIVIMLAGLAEGFLEPARNKAALSTEIRQKYNHSHVHLDVGFSSSGGVILGAHDHSHEHEHKPDTLIGAFQAIGIVFFGLGSLTGSWFLGQGHFLADVTLIGGVCLFCASLMGLLFAVFQKRENYIEISNRKMK